MRRNNRALFRAARSILQDDSEAEDAVQEAYVRAYQTIGNFRGDSKLATWLTRIVINEALEKLRRRKPTVALENVVDLETQLNGGGTLQSAPEQPDAAAIRSQTRQLLERKIDQLPAAFRTVFVL